MSVIFYRAEELGETAACASIASPQLVGGDIIGMLSRRLAEFSKANANAYAHTYGAADAKKYGIKAHDAGSIEAQARAYLDAIKGAPPPKGACSRAQHNLAYNAVANDGTDFASEELKRAIGQLASQAERAAKLYERKDAAYDAAIQAREVEEAKAGRYEMMPAQEGLKPYKPPAPVFDGDRERYDKRTAVNRIKKALKARTGRDYNVKTSNTWQDSIDIRVPEERRECFFDGRRTVSQREMRERWAEAHYGKYDPEKADDLFKYPCKDDRELLAKAMDMSRDYRGELPSEYSCFGHNCTPVSVALAEGRKSTMRTSRYDYD